MSVMDCVDMDVGVGQSYVVIAVTTLDATITILVADKTSIKPVVYFRTTSDVRKCILFNSSLHIRICKIPFLYHL